MSDIEFGEVGGGFCSRSSFPFVVAVDRSRCWPNQMVLYAIVPETLKGDKYMRRSRYTKTYLKGQVRWDLIAGKCHSFACTQMASVLCSKYAWSEICRFLWFLEWTCHQYPQPQLQRQPQYQSAQSLEPSTLLFIVWLKKVRNG